MLESIYESAMCIEFDDVKIEYARQATIPAYYKGHLPGQYRVDLVVQDLVLVEIKSVERPAPVFEAQPTVFGLSFRLSSVRLLRF